jgi:hypothetical protein
MAGGQKIDDYSFWGGKAPAGKVFPEEVKTKTETSAEGAGELKDYEDTTEKIRASQVMADGKIKKNATKPLMRN